MATSNSNGRTLTTTNWKDTYMTKEEMYELLKVKYEQTDWNNFASVKAYNEYARCLRQLVCED